MGGVADLDKVVYKEQHFRRELTWAFVLEAGGTPKKKEDRRKTRRLTHTTDCGGASTFLSPLSMTNPVTAIYREDNSQIHISPSHEHYPSVVRDFILPHVDFFTTLVVVAGDDDYAVDDVTEIEFRFVQEHPSLFAITHCNDYHFLKFYMVKNNLVSANAPLDVLDNFLWQDYELYGIMLQERSSLVNISRDGFETRIVLTDWDDEDIDPEVHTLIGHLGQGDGHVQNPLALLPVK
ncbi:hypothetical protein JTE90_019196 [Oedothorax gibbosus]|uniref:Uncharacterized protein n=1 Tax=Oedothorax gibbosus TaxID=931172 RepID=A0AAV6TMS8_9ARAC|nr:hypothetical protein JTE90_019196 [Oedothorax gibbosus]